jgi:hypothetical protein
MTNWQVTLAVAIAICTASTPANALNDSDSEIVETTRANLPPGWSSMSADQLIAVTKLFRNAQGPTAGFTATSGALLLLRFPPTAFSKPFRDAFANIDADAFCREDVHGGDSARGYLDAANSMYWCASEGAMADRRHSSVNAWKQREDLSVVIMDCIAFDGNTQAMEECLEAMLRTARRLGARRLGAVPVEIAQFALPSSGSKPVGQAPLSAESKSISDTPSDTPTSGNEKADPYWSDNGWRTLRWGMSSRDVKKRIKTIGGFDCENAPPNPDIEDPKTKRVLCRSLLADPVFRQMIDAMFSFENGRLEGVTLLAESSNEGSMRALQRKIEIEASRAFGAGSCRDVAGLARDCHWNRRRTVVSSHFAKDSDEQWSVMVVHRDPMRYAESMRQLLDRHRATSSELTKTPKDKWSACGWRDCQWGMGPGDVIERIEIAPASVFTKVFDKGEKRSFETILDDFIFERPVSAYFSFVNGELDYVVIQPLALDENPATDLPQEDTSSWYASAFRVLKDKYGEPICEKGSNKLCRFDADSGCMTVTIEVWLSRPTIRYRRGDAERLRDPNAKEKL